MQRDNNNKKARLDEIYKSLRNIQKEIEDKSNLVFATEVRAKDSQAQAEILKLKQHYESISIDLLVLESEARVLRSSEQAGESVDAKIIDELSKNVSEIFQGIIADTRLNNLVERVIPLWLGEDRRVNQQQTNRKPKPLPATPVRPNTSKPVAQNQRQADLVITSNVYNQLSTIVKFDCLEKSLPSSDSENISCVKNYIELKKIMENKNSGAAQVTGALMKLQEAVKANSKISDVNKEAILELTTNVYNGIVKPGSSLNQNTTELDRLLINNLGKDCVKEYNRNLESFENIERYISVFENQAKRNNSDSVPRLNARCAEAKNILLQSGDFSKVMAVLNGDKDKELVVQRGHNSKFENFFTGARERNKQKFSNMKQNISEVIDAFEKRNNLQSSFKNRK